jgi:hypothetical protein
MNIGLRELTRGAAPFRVEIAAAVDGVAAVADGIVDQEETRMEYQLPEQEAVGVPSSARGLFMKAARGMRLVEGTGRKPCIVIAFSSSSSGGTDG